MCACMWVYACLYVCVCVCVRVHTYVCGYVRVGEFVGVGTCACARACGCMRVCMRACVYIRICVGMCMWVSLWVSALVHVRMCVCGVSLLPTVGTTFVYPLLGPLQDQTIHIGEYRSKNSCLLTLSRQAPPPFLPRNLCCAPFQRHLNTAHTHTQNHPALS